MWKARRPLVWVGYLCYVVGLFFLFTYLTFPSQQMRAFVLSSVNRYGIGQIRIDAVQPLLPAGMRFRGVSFSHEVDGQPLELLRLPELRVSLQTLLPFVNPLRLGFAGEAYGGRVAGALEWEHHGRKPVLGINVDLQDVRPGAHSLTTKLGDGLVVGKLAGTIALQLSNGRWQDGDGRLLLRGESGNIAALSIGGIHLPALTYEQLSIDLGLQQRQLTVRDIQLSGRDWRLAVQGSVSVSERLRQSPLDLTVRVYTSELLAQQLGLAGLLLKQRRDRLGFSTLKINGTLERPTPVL
jgi:type II secretion system protein N